MKLLEQRQIYFDKYITKKEKLTLEDLNLIYESCANDDKSKHDYFMAFFKLAVEFIALKEENLELLMKWVNLIDYSTLDFTKNNYSNLDMYLIKTFKIMCLKPNDIFVKGMYLYHKEKRTEFKESYFFVDYNYCIYLYSNKNNNEARNLFLKLLKYKQDDYLIYQPIRYYDTDLSQVLVPMILMHNSIDKYSYNIIMSYLKKCSFINDPKFIKSAPSQRDIEELKNLIANGLVANREQFNIKLGKLKGISKGGHGFVHTDNNSYFIPKKHMKNDFIIDKNYYFFSYKSYDYMKKLDSVSAFIIKEDL